MHFLRKAQNILDLDLRPVVKHCRSAHPAKNLMLVGNDHFEIEAGRAVQDWYEIHLEAPVRGAEFPWIRIAAFRDVEGHVVEFVRLSVVEKDIFRGSLRITEAIADIEAETVSVKVRIP